MPVSTRLTVGTALAALGLVISAAPPAAAAVPGDLDWFFTEAAAPSSTRSFDFGNLLQDGDFPLVCDATGDGDLPAVWNDGTFTLRSGATGTTSVRFGRDSDYPLCGDWDGDGVDTPGVARGNVYILASANRDGGGSPTAFAFGRADDFPLVGDWDGDGIDEIALARGSQYIFASANSPGGGALSSSVFGRADDFPVAGDWTDAGYDTVALQRGSQFFVTYDRPGTRFTADRTFGFGRADDYPVAGTLGGSTRASVGVVRVDF